ncbi:MAG TPA: hypothetical protein DGG95_16330 [Cytophagales bacterium]|jgi:hypothetical protein|nr:hypothetical protein [Cytophagales bacterium]
MTKIYDVLSKALIVSGVVLLSVISYRFFQAESLEELSKFGGSVGGLIGSIWSLAGILLFYLALTEQRKDIRINQETLKSQIKSLDLQIEEYKLQRLELEETRNVLKEQSTTFRIQQFESTFFNMMSLLQEIINEMEIELNGKTGKGRSFFKMAYENLQAFVKQHNTSNNDPRKIIEKQLMAEAVIEKSSDPYGAIEGRDLEDFKMKAIEIYEDFYKYYHNHLGHYFRFLFNIWQFVLRSNLDDVERRRYLNLIQAQMSSYELSLLFYNALSKHGIKFHDLLDESGFFENIDGKALLFPLTHIRFYPNTKFKFVDMRIKTAKKN